MRYLITGLVVAFAAALFAGGAAIGAAYMYDRSVSNPTVQSGCVIRFDQRTAGGQTRPRLYANASHFCVGVVKVYAEYPSGALVIDQQATQPVINISVSPDETLVARGISCGASGGFNVTKVYCRDYSGPVKAYSSKMYGSSSNLWIGWTSWGGPA